MPRAPKGKPLTYRPVRLDDDVWAECQRLGKEHGTINEGIAVAHEALNAGDGARIERLEAQLQGVMERAGFHNASWMNGLPEGSLSVVEEPRWRTKVDLLLEENRRLCNEAQDLRAACEHYAERAKKVIELLS